MIVREILDLEELPLYVSWEPFLLTFSVYMGAFMIIAIGSVKYAPKIPLNAVIKRTSCQ